MNRGLPTRALREYPDLNQLKRQAKELLQAFIAGEDDAVAEVNTHYRDANRATFALHDAQFVLARAYGFDSWPKLKAHVDGITVKRLVDAVRADDLVRVRALLKVRPELAHMSLDNLQVLHHAVLNRSPEMVRILMEHGASARDGVYPHREATTSLAIAADRGYDEIVEIIKQEEQRRRERKSGVSGAPETDALFRAIRSADNQPVIAMLDANPALVHAVSIEGWTPLHMASRALNAPVVAALLERAADASVRGPHDLTPLDVAAYVSSHESAPEFARVAQLLLGRNAPMTSWAAAALGDSNWLRARNAEGSLTNPIEDSGGLLRIAASHDRREILQLLLDFGFDPDERTRFGGGDEDVVVFTWGMPLWHCASNGKYEMAELLLQRGADPNADVYASGTPVYRAYDHRDWKMVELLRRYGGLANGTVAGLYRQTELARQLIAGSGGNPKPDGMFEGRSLGEELLWAGACGGDPEIVRMALELVQWPRDDPRWFGILEQPLRMKNHSPGYWGNDEWDRGTYLTCFRLILERCDPNVRGRTTDLGQFGLTILHSLADARAHVMPAERVAFATALLDAGGRVDVRDNLLKSTPLGWACRWGQVELVKLLLERGADPLEADAEPWATPRAWAEKMKHGDVLALLQERLWRK
jgi:ankyrin repeat protein